ncbi:hypothetical protein CSC2_23480 [Clostridium zeae]|uniref:Uncharacterized protein n=1 Tax=Clostridium zeae TaxID=2759022 RepID=A0ABQ1EAI9_9CLOT|nr:hypothetical protein CSC2_23480 [Clostridium zeae]
MKKITEESRSRDLFAVLESIVNEFCLIVNDKIVNINKLYMLLPVYGLYSMFYMYIIQKRKN